MLPLHYFVRAFPHYRLYKLLLLALSETRCCLIQLLICPDCSYVHKYPILIMSDNENAIFGHTTVWK